ncbi:MAG: sensor histidine kinase [Verrucomicrobiaceae bacterium]
MRARLHFALLFLVQSLVGYGTISDNWFYRVWQTEDGLPDNSVSAIAQSSEGYLWIGTNGGLIRFNGISFTTLPLREIPNLPSKQVHSMTLDHQGQVWMGMERGPIISIGDTSVKTLTEADGVINRRTSNLTVDLQGRIWIAYTIGVCLVENGKVTRFGKNQGVPQARQSGTACDSDGNIWLASGPKLKVFKDLGFEEVFDFKKSPIKIAASRDSGLWITHESNLIHFKSADSQTTITRLPPDTQVTAIKEDHKGAIWIGTRQKGLFRFHQAQLQSVPTSHLWINCISEDHDGNIWAGTNGGGLNLILPRIAKLTSPGEGFPLPSVRSVCRDASGRLWITSLDGQLAVKEALQWQLFDKLPQNCLANCVTSDTRGRIWVGTQQHGLLEIRDNEVHPLDPAHTLASNSIRSLHPSKNGGLWIATSRPDKLYLLQNNGITPISSPISLKPIRAITETTDGTTWIGTAEGHLLRVDGQELIDESAIDGPTLRSIRTLHATPDGSLWIGYAGDGLGHLKNGTYRRLTTENGLHDDYLSQIQHDPNGNLWIAANRGLFRLSLEHLLSDSSHLYCQVYGRDNGLPSIQPSRDYAPSSVNHPNGKLYFSTHSGLLEVNTNDALNNTPPPPVILENISLNNEPIALFKKRSILPPDINSRTADLSDPNPAITLPPDHDNLVISFAALNFATPENTLTRYRLHPVDKKWQVIDKQGRVTFPRLPAGNYRFQVIASNGAGDWNKEGASVTIKVKPFFWETWWFKFGIATLTALIAGGIVFLGLRRKHQNQLQAIAAKQALEQERSRIARDIHDDLGASLTRISLLSQSSSAENDQPQSAMGQIRSTTRNLMRAMDGVVWAISPEHDEFDDLANYLSSYAQEFLSVAGIRCRLLFPVDLPEQSLSAQLRHNLLLASKEALNNIVKYAQASEVRISLIPEDHHFILKFEDNGKGIDPNAPSDPARSNAGSGLTNMEKRMKEIGGVCNFHSTIGKGTTVEFIVPFKANPLFPVT